MVSTPETFRCRFGARRARIGRPAVFALVAATGRAVREV
jgi:hypothetical protein